MEENGYTVPDDEMEPQTAGFVPGYNPYGDGDDYGDYPAYCHRYTTDSGDEHVEMCGFHAQLAANQSLPGLEKWTNELNDLYKEWIDLSMEKDRAAVASSQAFFTLWLEQQRIVLEQQGVENVDDHILNNKQRHRHSNRIIALRSIVISLCRLLCIRFRWRLFFA